MHGVGNLQLEDGYIVGPPNTSAPCRALGSCLLCLMGNLPLQMDLAVVFTPYYLRNGWSYERQILCAYSQDRSDYWTKVH